MSEYKTTTTRRVRHGYAEYAESIWRILYEDAVEGFDKWLTQAQAEAAADGLREAAQAMRAAKEPYHWNLRDPRDPETSYSPDVWLEVRAERLREGVQ